MFEGFKKFALKGNVFDLAVGVMIGGAFGKIVSSLVSDIITPIISIITNKVDFTNLFFTIGGTQEYETLAQAKAAGVTTLSYGVFLQNIIDFFIIALTIYLVVSSLEKFKRKPDNAASIAVNTKDCPYCYTQIHIKATRCPHCTAELEINKESN
jgi:large conductance mechanosensitive channel